MHGIFKFRFPSPKVRMSDVTDTLHDAVVACEGLTGEARVRLEVSFEIDEADRSLLVDASTESGGLLVRLATRMFTERFGSDGFDVRPVPRGDLSTSEEQTR